MSDADVEPVESVAPHGEEEQENVITDEEPATLPASELPDSSGGDGVGFTYEVPAQSDAINEEEAVIDEGQEGNEENDLELPESKAAGDDVVDMEEEKETESQVSDVKMQLLSKLKYRLETLGKTQYFCHDCGVNCNSQTDYVQHTLTTEHINGVTDRNQRLPENYKSAEVDTAVGQEPAAEQDDVKRLNAAEGKEGSDNEDVELELSRDDDETSETEGNDADCYIELDADEDTAAGNEESSIYYCEACDVICRTETAYHNHTRGLTHIMKVESTASTTAGVEQNESNVFYCATCNVKCENEMAYNNHTRGMTHTMKSGQVEAAKIAAKSEKKPAIIEAPVEPDQKFSDKVAKDNFYCEVCDCCMTGPQSFQMHIDGIRHKKNVKHRSVGAPISRPGGKLAMATGSQISIVVDRPPKIQQMIDACKEPLIGMQFLCEYRQEREDVAPRYLCNLCEAVCDMRLIIQHLTGYKHRLAYMRKCHTNYAVLVQTSSKKSIQSKTMETFAREIEENEGRQSMVVRLEGSFPGNALTMSITGPEGRTLLEEPISSESDGEGRRSRSSSIDRFLRSQKWRVVDDADDNRNNPGHRRRQHSSRYSRSPRRHSRGPPRYHVGPLLLSPDHFQPRDDRRSQEYHSPSRYSRSSRHVVSEAGPWSQDLPDIDRQRYGPTDSRHRDRDFEEWRSSEQLPIDWNSREQPMADRYQETSEYPDEGRQGHGRHRHRHYSRASRSRSRSKPRRQHRRRKESHRDRARSRSQVTISSSSSQSPSASQGRSDLQSWNKHCEKFLQNLDRERGEIAVPTGNGVPLPSVADVAKPRMPAGYVPGPGAQAVLSGLPPRALLLPPGYPPFYFPPHPFGPPPPGQFPGPFPYPYPPQFPPIGVFPRGGPVPLSAPPPVPPPDARLPMPTGPMPLMNIDVPSLPPTRGSTVYVSDQWNGRDLARNNNSVRRVQPSESIAIRSAMAAVLADAVLMFQQKHH